MIDVATFPLPALLLTTGSPVFRVFLGRSTSGQQQRSSSGIGQALAMQLQQLAANNPSAGQIRDEYVTDLVDSTGSQCKICLKECLGPFFVHLLPKYVTAKLVH